jgi:hypothetical protein
MNPTLINDDSIQQVPGHEQELIELKQQFEAKVARVGEREIHRIQMSANKASKASGIKRTSFRRILKKDLQFKPYKVQENQKLYPRDPPQRVAFAKQLIRLVESRRIRIEDILISDECYVYSDGYRNKQNVRFWHNEKPPYFNEKSLHSEKLGIWAGLCGDFIVGPYFFEDFEGNNVNVNAQNYVEMIDNFLWPQLVEKGAQDRIIFQQDGAPAHTSRHAMGRLKELFPDRLISQKGGNINWPPRSPDLSSCDFFLWGRIKEIVFQQNPKDRDDMKQCIREAFAQIEVDELKKVSNEFLTRCRLVASPAINGGAFEHTL